MALSTESLIFYPCDISTSDNAVLYEESYPVPRTKTKIKSPLVRDREVHAIKWNDTIIMRVN